MNTFLNRIKRIVSIAAICSLMTSLCTFNAMAEETADQMADYCLTSDGSIRDGVSITAHYSRNDGSEFVYSGEQTSGADGGSDMGEKLNRVLTTTPEEYTTKQALGFFGGWKKNAISASYYIQVDLGKERSINQVGVVPMVNNNNGGDIYWRRGRIYLSNDEDFEEKFEVTSGATAFEGFKLNTYSFDKADTKKYRYLRFYLTDGSVFGASHISIKGYCEDLFGLWSHTQSGADYNVSIPVDHFGDEKTYTMMSALYNADGDMVGFNSERVSAVDGKLSNTVTADGSATTVWSGLMNNADELIYSEEQYSDGELPMRSETVELSGKNFAEFSEDNNVITVKAKSENPNNIITLLALKNCDKAKSAEEYFSEIGEDLNGNIQYAAAKQSGDGVVLDVKLTEKDTYFFKVTESGESDSKSLYYRFSLIPESEKEDFVKKVFATDGSDWKDIVSYYCDDLEMITESNLHDITVIKDENFAKTLIKARDMLYSGDQHTMSEAIELINSAITLDALYDGNYEKAGEYIKTDKLLASAVGEYADWTSYTVVLGKLLDESADKEETLRVLKSAAVLSYIQGATASKVAEALTKYEKELGVDLSLCKEYNVSLERVCARLDVSNAYIYDNGKMKSAFEDAVKAEADKKKETTSSSKPKSSGGGGSSVSYGGSTTQKPNDSEKDNEQQQQNPDINNSENQDSKIIFSDIDGYEWAKDSIYRLSEENIISGVGNDRYVPENHVTRAEFAKMIVNAIGITVDEENKMHFMDCTGADWFYPYVVICYSTGICNGVDEYHYNPSASITRQDMAVMLSKAIAYKGLDFTADEKKCNEQLAEYAEEAFEKILKAGIINGYEDGTFRPYNSVTRAEAAVILCNTMDFVSNGGIR